MVKNEVFPLTYSINMLVFLTIANSPDFPRHSLTIPDLSERTLFALTFPDCINPVDWWEN